MIDLLKKLCGIASTSGDESAISEFILSYIQRNKSKWKVQPELFYGEDFQHCIVLVFGNPQAAVFAHIDNIGYTARYGNQLVKVGGPHAGTGTLLVGHDSTGPIECELIDDDKNLRCHFPREIDRGTSLSYKMNFREDEQYVQSCYLDNRLGVMVALTLCETLENGMVVFSCWEEHGGGSVSFLAKFMYEKYRIKKSLICDITWITEGVRPGKGVVVSMRDSGIPRRQYIYSIIGILKRNEVSFQLEVEGSGGSDGNELQRQPYPIDWCFVGAAEDFVHSPDEKVHKEDIASMLHAYQVLMKEMNSGR